MIVVMFYHVMIMTLNQIVPYDSSVWSFKKNFQKTFLLRFSWNFYSNFFLLFTFGLILFSLLATTITIHVLPIALLVKEV